MRRASVEDTDKINELLNDPLVRPSSGGDGYLDVGELLAMPLNRLYFDERGGAIFAWRGPGIYEGHSFFIARGREALRAGQECLDEMTDAAMIWGATPEANRAARWFNRQLGFKSLGMIEMPAPYELFVLEK